MRILYRSTQSAKAANAPNPAIKLPTIAFPAPFVGEADGLTMGLPVPVPPGELKEAEAEACVGLGPLSDEGIVILLVGWITEVGNPPLLG